MIETPGHARHHTCVVDHASGTVIAGDAVGVAFPGGGLYPALPPPDVDLAAGVRSLDRLAAIAPERLLLAHFGPAGDPAATIDLARRQLRLMGEAGRAAAGPEAIADEIERRLPLEATVGDAGRGRAVAAPRVGRGEHPRHRRLGGRPRRRRRVTITPRGVIVVTT